MAQPESAPQLSVYHCAVLGGDSVLKNILVFPDGSEISSGPGTVNALQKVRITQRVNTGTELTLGAACATMLEATLFTPNGGMHIAPGTEITLYQEDKEGVRTKAGLFTIEKANRPSANRYQITAYDRISRLDRDLRQWLESLSGWPYSLQTFAEMVCAACNLTLATDALPNGDWPVQKFSARAVTGRRIMQWVGQACGRFCRATADGEIAFDWYTPRDITLTPQGEHYYYLDTLQAEDYQIAPVSRVQIRMTEKDVGATYGSGDNAYVMTGNYLLATDSNTALQKVAQMLYGTLSTVTYTPCSVTIPATAEIRAGDILQVTDKNGRSFSLYVMTKVQSGQRDTLSCVGNAYRNSATAIGNSQFVGFDGRLLELELGIDGLRLENVDRDGKAARLEATVDGLRSKVTEHQEGIEEVADRISIVEQTAEGLSIRVRNVTEDGVSRVNTSAGYVFDENGLTVSKSGKEIKTQITENGMTVYKNNRVVLTANSEGVDAVDLHASTYLIVAGKSRFEKYKSNRIGCFWVAKSGGDTSAVLGKAVLGKMILGKGGE